MGRMTGRRRTDAHHPGAKDPQHLLRRLEGRKPQGPGKPFPLPGVGGAPPGEDAVAPSGDGAASVGIGGGPAPEPPSGGGAASGWQRGDGTRAGVGVPATRKPSGWVNVAAPGVPHGAHAAPAVAHATAPAASELPSGKQRYRCLTGPDDASFCEKVSAALAEGYVLQGGPAVTFDGKRVIVAQAVVWPGRVE